MMTMSQLSKAAKEIHQWLEWDRESIDDFHAFAQRFGCQPGANVYTFVLQQALTARGLTLDQLRANRRDRTA